MFSAKEAAEALKILGRAGIKIYNDITSFGESLDAMRPVPPPRPDPPPRPTTAMDIDPTTVSCTTPYPSLFPDRNVREGVVLVVTTDPVTGEQKVEKIIKNGKEERGPEETERLIRED